jgi:hypothetical protein
VGLVLGLHIGWVGINPVDAVHASPLSLQEHFKLLNQQPNVKETLDQAGFVGYLESHFDLETAPASF